MPPKAKFSKEEIVTCALDIVREYGFSAMSARSLGEALGSSPRPIFTVFESMEELQGEVVNAAKAEYNKYVQRGLSQDIPFKGVGMQYILFSINEPKLFQLLFMKEQSNLPNIQGILPLIEDNYTDILKSIQDSYGLNEDLSLKLYQHLWIYCHGIATLCACHMCHFTSEQISDMMSELCMSLIKQIKKGELS